MASTGWGMKERFARLCEMDSQLSMWGWMSETRKGMGALSWAVRDWFTAFSIVGIGPGDLLVGGSSWGDMDGGRNEPPAPEQKSITVYFSESMSEMSFRALAITSAASSAGDVRWSSGNRCVH